MRRSALTAAWGGLACAGVALWVACESPLAAPYQLTSSRVLAIQSNPVDLLPDASVALQALLYLPPGSPTPTYQWSWCAAVGSTLQCAISAQQLTTILDPDASLGVDVDYSLGSSAQAVFSYPVSPAILQSACLRFVFDGGTDGGEGGADDGGDAGEQGILAASAVGDDAAVEPGGSGRLACNGSTWTIDVLLTVGVGDQSLQAVRTLTLYLAAPASINHNPAVVGLSPFTMDLDAGDAGPLANPGDQAEGGIVDAGVGTMGEAGIVVAADIPLSAAEVYGAGPLADLSTGDGGFPPCPADADAVSLDAGCVPQVRESLSLAWYTQGGLLAHATTDMPGVGLSAPQDWSSLLLNEWAAPFADGGTDFVLVVRDNRGGVGWLRQTAQLPVK